MQEKIDQIYWGPVQKTYMAGTQIEKFPDSFIYLKNNLMASGKKINSWWSITDYQRDKEVPSLPALINGHHYKLKFILKTVPENTLIYRLNFYGIQGTIIKQITFSENKKDFIFPMNAKSYSIEMFNAGCEELHFKRIQLADNNVADGAFQDVFFNPVREKNKSPKGDNLVLVLDSKRLRQVEPDLGDLDKDINLTVVNVSWQYKGALTEKLNDWIADHIIYGFTIFSTNPRLDQAALDVRESFPQINVITSKQLNVIKKQKELLHPWYKNNIYSPDWFMISRELENYLGE